MKDYEALIREMVVQTSVPSFFTFYDQNAEYLDSDGNVLPKLTEWITYNPVSENTRVRADDDDDLIEILYDVHWYMRDYSAWRKKRSQLKSLLRAAGFVIESTNFYYENDTDMGHIVVTVSDTYNILED